MTMSFSLIFSGFTSSTATAQSNASLPPVLEKTLDSFEETTSEVSKEVEKRLLKLTKNQLKNKLIGLEIKDLDLEKAKTFSLNGSGYFVQYPIRANSDYEIISNISFTVDSDFKISSVVEVNLKLIDEEHADLQVWSDGKNTINQILEKPDVQPQWSFSKFTKCLGSELGVSWAVISTIAMLCTPACMATVGVGCVLCVTAGGSLTGFNWGYCIAKASR